jgi:DNA-binding winged helix-turn-helix (wHTH) protein
VRSVYIFGDYIFETSPDTLSRGVQTIPAPTKQLSLLRVLLQGEGNAVKKETLLREAWPGSDVEDHTLVQTIYLLRLTLGKMSDGREYVETVPRYGYRIAASISQQGLAFPESDPWKRPARGSGFVHSLSQIWRRFSSSSRAAV